MFAQVLHYNPVQRTYSCYWRMEWFQINLARKKTQKKEWQRKHIHSLSGTTLHCTPFAVGFHHPERSNLFCKCAIFFHATFTSQQKSSFSLPFFNGCTRSCTNKRTFESSSIVAGQKSRCVCVCLYAHRSILNCKFLCIIRFSLSLSHPSVGWFWLSALVTQTRSADRLRVGGRREKKRP